MSDKFDLIVIGGGPGGYVAAIRAAQLGMNVALVESQHMGGICLNWGCIPTKALLKSAELYSAIGHSEDFGVKVSGAEFDFAKIIKRSRQVSKKLSSGISHLMKKNKVKTYDAYAKLNGAGAVRLFDRDEKYIEDLEAKNIIVATGARARCCQI